MKGGGCWRCRRGGTYLPPGRGERGRGPEAPSRGSRRQLHDRQGTDGRSPRTPSGSASGAMCPQLDRPPAVPAAGAAHSRAGAGRAGVSQGQEQQPQERGRLAERAGSSPGRGAGHGGPLAGERGGAWRQQEQQEQPRCASAPVACLPHLATGLAAPVQTPSLSKLTRAASTAKGIKKAVCTHLPQAQRREKKIHLEVSFPRKGRPAIASSYVPRSLLSCVGTHCCYSSLLA